MCLSSPTLALTVSCLIPHFAVLSPGEGHVVALPADGLAVSELSSSASTGDTAVPVAALGGFHVGGVVRLHPGYPNQEDHRIRAISHTSLWLASAGLEFPHERSEAIELLAIVPDCPNNCSSIAACVNRVCDCPEGFAGDDCSVDMASNRCLHDCHGNGLCIGGSCACHAGFTGAFCQTAAQLCPFNCSGHGLCSDSGVCACEPGFSGVDCSTATPDCAGNCTGHGTCANSECTCDFGYSGRARLPLPSRNSLARSFNSPCCERLYAAASAASADAPLCVSSQSTARR